MCQLCLLEGKPLFQAFPPSIATHITFHLWFGNHRWCHFLPCGRLYITQLCPSLEEKLKAKRHLKRNNSTPNIRRFLAPHLLLTCCCHCYDPVLATLQHQTPHFTAFQTLGNMLEAAWLARPHSWTFVSVSPEWNLDISIVKKLPGQPNLRGSELEEGEENVQHWRLMLPVHDSLKFYWDTCRW